jgi:hypothetical protein
LPEEEPPPLLALPLLLPPSPPICEGDGLLELLLPQATAIVARVSAEPSQASLRFIVHLQETRA